MPLRTSSSTDLDIARLPTPSTPNNRNPLFDPAFYAARYSLSALDDTDLYRHYLYTGRLLGYNPNEYFETTWYLLQNRDIRGVLVNPLDHYLEHGAMEGRDPSPAFSSWLYCVLYPDVKASGMNPLLHYLRHGRREGRLAPPAFVSPVSNVGGDEDNGARGRAALPALRRLSEWTSQLLDPATVAEGSPEADGGCAIEPPRGREPGCRSYRSPVETLSSSAGDADGPSEMLAARSDCWLGRRQPSHVSRVSDREAERVAARVIARRSRWLVRWFAAIFARDLASSFQAVRLLGTIPAVRGPLVVFTNHPSWWDAELFAWLAATAFSERRAFAAMDSANLARYRLLSRLGAFPTRPGSFGGAAAFLVTAERVLEAPDALLYVVAEGRFRDVRERPIRPMPGLAHLARRIPEATFVPLAIDYAFWNERRPNLLLRFGEPIRADALEGSTKAATTVRLGTALADAMSTLAEAAQSREPRRFKTLLEGSLGFAGLHELWCRARALTGSLPAKNAAPAR